MEPPQPHKTHGYQQLVERFGVERVAAATLTKWLSDNDAMDKWEHLAAAVQIAPRTACSPNARLDADQPTPTRPPFKYWVVLWYFSMGYTVRGIAEQLDLSVETIKQDVKYAKNALGLTGVPVAAAVAAAIRKGVIP